MIKEFILTESELTILFDYLDSKNYQQHIFLLQGDLASGKTTFVKNYIAHKNAYQEVTSPTFSLMHHYNGFYHYDIYHHGLQKALELGLLENLEQDGIHFIEWGDEKLENILKNSGYNYSIIKILKDNNKRIYRIIDGQTSRPKSQ